VPPPKLDALLAALRDAKRAEHTARLAWRRAAERFPQGHPRRKEALNGYRKTKAVRRRLDAQIARSQNARRTSPKGVDFLIAEEGFVPYAYNDSQNHATFGVGHLLHRGPVTPADRALWGTKVKPKPRELVVRLLHEDLADRFEPAVRDTIKKPLKAHQFDALISLAFNIGAEGFKSSTVARRVNQGDFHGAADAILMWNKPPELLSRRRRERELFLTGKYR
jgi:lysozyme